MNTNSQVTELTVHLLTEEWESVSSAEGPGWYALDEKFVCQLGPYDTKRDCEKAIRRAARQTNTL
mgnify:CR=1 FL=1